MFDAPNRVRIGVYGGTFDPPHVGHLIVAECAADALNLSRILFVPAADPPHKRDQSITLAAHRVAMLNLAISGNPRFELSRLDLERPGPHYSADMVRLVHAQQPDAELFFVMGGDSLVNFPTWYAPAEIVRYAMLAVVLRPTAPIDWAALTAKVPEIEGRVTFIPAPDISIAATDIRQRAQARQSLRYQTPNAVIAYIRQNHLYEDSET